MRSEISRRSMVTVWILGFGAVISAGCQSRVAGTPDLAPVTGTVTIDGQPADKAIVSFEGPGNKVSFGNTDSAGHYELHYIRQEKGAAIGANKVKITTRIDAPPGPGYIDSIPAKYNTGSTLTADVQKGLNTIDFAIKTKE